MKRRFKQIDKNIYEFRVKLRLSSYASLFEKLENNNSRAIKKHMVLVYELFSEDSIWIMDEGEKNIIFCLFDDEELEHVLSKNNKTARGILYDCEECNDGYFELRLFIGCKKMPKKLIIEETQESSTKQSSSDEDTVEITLPISEDVYDFIDKEMKTFEYNGTTRDYRISVPIFDKTKVYFYDLYNNKVRLTVEDSKALAKFLEYGEVIGKIVDVDIPENVTMDSTIRVVFKIRPPQEKITLESLSKSAPHNLRTTELQIWVCFDMNGNNPHQICIMNGNIRSNVVGGDYIEGYQSISGKIKVGDSVRLVKEPDNPYDENAIAVYWKGKMIGHIPRTNIPAVALCMGEDELKAEVYENNLGWVAVYIESNLRNIGKREIIERFGDYYFEIHNDESALAINKEQFCKLFYYK